MKLNAVELFKAGQQIDSSGMSMEWSTGLLEEIAAAYNEAVKKKLHDAPAIVEHSGTKPIGWAHNLKVKSGKLIGDFAHMSEAMVSGLRDRSLRKRSVGFYPPEHPQNPTPGRWNLRHVAFVPVPAVKGLKDIDPSSIFSEANLAPATAGHFDFGQPLDGVCCFEHSPAFQEGDCQMKTVEELTKLVEMRDARIKTLEAEMGEMKKKHDKREMMHYVEGLVVKGIVPAGQRDQVVSRILEIPDTAESAFSFAEDDGTMKRLTPRQLYMRQLSGSPQVVSTGALATPQSAPDFAEGSLNRADLEAGFDPESIKMDAAVRAIQAERKCDFAEAFDLYVAQSAIAA